MNAIGFYGLHIITAGSYEGTAYCTQNGENYKKLFFRDNKLVGFILMGSEIKRAGIYTTMIKQQTDLAGVDMELLKEKPQLLMFGKDVRRQKLANV